MAERFTMDDACHKPGCAHDDSACWAHEEVARERVTLPILDYDDGYSELCRTECGVHCENPEHTPGTMLSDGMECFRKPGHKGRHVCLMCPDAFDFGECLGICQNPEHTTGDRAG